MNKQELLDCYAGSMSMTMGTSDFDKNPTFCRVWGVHFANKERTELKVILPKAVASKALSDLKVNKSIAVTIADMINFFTVQYKGEVIRIAESTPEETAIAEESRDRSNETLQQFFGNAGNGWGRFAISPAYTIQLRITEVYNQTPGKMAGTKLL